ncbi:MAG: hypothetical protein AB1547_10035, partial [Thermodesulfobacteriota bacterium]
MEVYYNRQRIQPRLGNLSPAAFERQYYEIIKDGPATSRFSRAFRKCRASAGWLGKPFETAAKKVPQSPRDSTETSRLLATPSKRMESLKVWPSHLTRRKAGEFCSAARARRIGRMAKMERMGCWFPTCCFA